MSHPEGAPSDKAAQPQQSSSAAIPAACAYCRRPFAPDENAIVLMRSGEPVAAYHERCHPHYRRSGCSAC